jgi:hypothetical protein
MPELAPAKMRELVPAKMPGLVPAKKPPPIYLFPAGRKLVGGSKEVGTMERSALERRRGRNYRAAPRRLLLTGPSCTGLIGTASKRTPEYETAEQTLIEGAAFAFWTSPEAAG